MSSAEWSSPVGGAGAIIRAHRKAQQDGLKASAYIVYNAVKIGLRGGYTSGAFAVGNVINSVTIGPVTEEAGTFSVRIGTNVLYAVFWELGHHNLFTRKYERQERWRPALVDNREASAAAFARAYKRSMLGQGA
ncbi:MAG: hypothetical protein ABJA80_00810 [bacterium]